MTSNAHGSGHSLSLRSAGGSSAADRSVQVAPPSLVAHSNAWPARVPSPPSFPASTPPASA